jgi:L-threonylcarbamoyladenylate synthase
MDTQLITVDAKHPAPEAVARAAELLRAGELVAFPTETVYGLGANALDGEALAKIFVAKRRPTNDPIIAHIADPAQLRDLVREVPAVAERLAATFWPGPLTLILKRAATVPGIIAEGRDTIAVRMPAHPVARALLQAAGIPVGAPSANTFTRPSATTAQHVLEDLDGRIAMVLDGGPATIGVESTVLDLSGDEARVLRPGGVTLEALREVLPGVQLAPGYVSEHDGSHSPGQMIKHYSPRARVLLFRGGDRARVQTAMHRAAREELARGATVGALVVEEERDTLPAAVTCFALGPERDLETAARSLFAGLRELDSAGVDVILVRDPARGGLGDALGDRLLRAAEGRVVEVDPGTG